LKRWEDIYKRNSHEAKSNMDNESVGLRYFSLHKVNSEENMFMSLIGDGHFDMEASKLIENNKESFVTAIEEVMKGDSLSN